MAKKLVAVTGIKHNGVTYPAGAPIDHAKFSKDELKQLHDNGALVIEDDAKPEDVKVEEPAKAAEPAKTSTVAPSVPSVPAKEDAAAKK